MECIPVLLYSSAPQRAMLHSMQRQSSNHLKSVIRSVPQQTVHVATDQASESSRTHLLMVSCANPVQHALDRQPHGVGGELHLLCAVGAYEAPCGWLQQGATCLCVAGMQVQLGPGREDHPECTQLACLRVAATFYLT